MTDPSPRILYDLAAADLDVRFSPFCWRAKMALAHKGLDYEARPLRFTEKSALPNPDYGRVPVLVDGERTIEDSWAIIAYLDEAYPEKPLIATGAERGAAEFFRAWTDTKLLPAFAPLLMIRVHDCISEEDKIYFRETREGRFGVTLEALAGDAGGHAKKIETAVQPLALALSRTPFLGGDAPGVSDYIVFSAFQWARCVCPEPLFEAPDALNAWIEKLLDAH
ncbi:MAG: glutathione S-transferase N-terminal domain-containing protein, partial [Pseudomonadota bacterium]